MYKCTWLSCFIYIHVLIDTMYTMVLAIAQIYFLHGIMQYTIPNMIKIDLQRYAIKTTKPNLF